jgi:polygalacturonase
MQRRLFMGGVLGALGVGPARMVQADTSFTEFKFPATDAPAARTMPDRLSDIVNVKDWGAAGLRADYRRQIQAAINFAIGPRPDGTTGGTVFFPPGYYVLHNLLVGSDSVNTGVIITGIFGRVKIAVARLAWILI